MSTVVSSFNWFQFQPVFSCVAVTVSRRVLIVLLLLLMAETLEVDLEEVAEWHEVSVDSRLSRLVGDQILFDHEEERTRRLEDHIAQPLLHARVRRVSGGAGGEYFGHRLRRWADPTWTWTRAAPTWSDWVCDAGRTRIGADCRRRRWVEDGRQTTLADVRSGIRSRQLTQLTLTWPPRRSVSSALVSSRASRAPRRVSSTRWRWPTTARTTRTDWCTWWRTCPPRSNTTRR